MNALSAFEQAALQMEVAKLRKQLAELDAQATIEALNLRVARLVDALKEVADYSRQEGSVLTEEECDEIDSILSAEGDQQWLREKQAEAVLRASAREVYTNFANRRCGDVT